MGGDELVERTPGLVTGRGADRAVGSRGPDVERSGSDVLQQGIERATVLLSALAGACDPVLELR